MLAQDLGVAVAMVAQQRRRSLDVCEQERDGALGKAHVPMFAPERPEGT